MGKPTPRDEITLRPEVTLNPFNKCGMDFIGPIDPPLRQKNCIIVFADYLKKWAKTKVVKVAIDDKLVDFLRENVFYKFGYPRELVTD